MCVCVCERERVCERVFLISADCYIVTVYFLFAPREDDDFIKAPKQKTSKDVFRCKKMFSFVECGHRVS